MRYSVASVFLCVLLISAFALAQTKSRAVKRSQSQSEPRKTSTSANGTLRICQGIDLPEGYVIVGYETTSACPHGAYLLKKDDARSRASGDATARSTQSASKPAAAPPPPLVTASRPRKVGDAQANPVAPKLSFEGAPTPVREPTLGGTPLTSTVNASAKDNPSTGVEEVGEGDVVRIDTNLVTVPVSVLDRQGRFVPNLKRDDFHVFENGLEQKIAYFEPTEKPFTVALLLDTSGSTVFHLWEIKEAAISFAKQLRPQDRVLVVTFNQDVLLLTEATNDLGVVTEVINQYANTGYSTRLYDAVYLVVNERLNQIKGRKAIVLFTDGVDTSSFQATYQSTMRDAEELDALIYPIQYDTTDFLAATQALNNVTITTRTSNWPYPSRTSSRVIYGPPVNVPGSTMADYQVADQYLHGLAEKSGGRLFQAKDRKQVTEAFSKIAEELRWQYSLGYYPQTSMQTGDRRLIKVRVNHPDLAVRARDGYVQRGAPKLTQ